MLNTYILKVVTTRILRDRDIKKKNRYYDKENYGQWQMTKTWTTKISAYISIVVRDNLNRTH